MKIPFDPEIAKEMKALIDPCGFSVIKAYFRDPTSEINQVILVQEGYMLEEVAAFLVDADDETAQDIFLKMLDSGAIKAGVDDFRKVRAAYEDNAILLDTVPDDQMCYVIYLPPMYLVKLTNQKWT